MKYGNEMPSTPSCQNKNESHSRAWQDGVAPPISPPTLNESEGEAAGKREQPESSEKKGKTPDFRIVQPGVGLDGRANYENVGAMWHNVSKAGADFYSLKIGNLKLLVFPNAKRE
ncbi:hypothetical protein AUJ17_03230 [Candidatus Micrarchaeota archaeon CG1_02_47_40]|nr:MAG: hypothetical protein AUJ17_03230 [Candidatus Micrarchaeota archaeon CG1_02_47_40]